MILIEKDLEARKLAMVQGLRRCGMEREAQRMANCGMKVSDGRTFYCGHPLCPVCSDFIRRKEQSIFYKIKPILDNGIPFWGTISPENVSVDEVAAVSRNLRRAVSSVFRNTAFRTSTDAYLLQLHFNASSRQRDFWNVHAHFLVYQHPYGQKGLVRPPHEFTEKVVCYLGSGAQTSTKDFGMDYAQKVEADSGYVDSLREQAVQVHNYVKHPPLSLTPEDFFKHNVKTFLEQVRNVDKVIRGKAWSELYWAISEEWQQEHHMDRG